MNATKTGTPTQDINLKEDETLFQVEIGRLRRVNIFKGKKSFEESIGKAVIVNTSWGLDIGRIIDSLVKFEGNILGSIIRLANSDDFAKSMANRMDDAQCRETFEECVKAQNLSMKLVGVEHSLEMRKTTFYYEAEGRVDFRQLVKTLAGRLKRRIEFHQLSQKEKFFFYPTYGSCGYKLCCSTQQSLFEQKIPTRATRSQGLIYHAEKVAGVCGKPRCCLMYELPLYQEFYDLVGKKGCCFTTSKTTPEEDTCPNCKFRVVDWNVILNKITLEEVNSESNNELNSEKASGRFVEVTLDELKHNYEKVK